MKPLAVVGYSALGVVAGGLVLFGVFIYYVKQSAPVRALNKSIQAAGELRSQTSAALKSASETKEEYQKRIMAEIDAMKLRIEELKKKSLSLRDGMSSGAHAQVGTLEKKRVAIADKLTSLSVKSGQAWVEMKKGLDAAVDDLKKSYDSAKEKFQEP